MKTSLFIILSSLAFYSAKSQCNKSFFPMAKQPLMAASNDYGLKSPTKNYYFFNLGQRKDSVYTYIDLVYFNVWDGKQWSSWPKMEIRTIGGHLVEWGNNVVMTGTFRYFNGIKNPKGKTMTAFILQNGVWDSLPGGLLDSNGYSFCHYAATEKNLYRARNLGSGNEFQMEVYNPSTKRFDAVCKVVCPNSSVNIQASRNRLLIANIINLNGVQVNGFVWIDSQNTVNTPPVQLKTNNNYVYGIDRQNDHIYFCEKTTKTAVYEFTDTIISARNTDVGYTVLSNYGDYQLRVSHGEIVWDLYDSHTRHAAMLCAGETRWQTMDISRISGVAPYFENNIAATDHGHYAIEMVNNKIVQLQPGTSVEGICYADVDTNCTLDDTIDQRMKMHPFSLGNKTMGFTALCITNDKGYYKAIVPKGNFQYVLSPKNKLSTCAKDTINIDSIRPYYRDVPMKIPHKTDLSVTHLGGFRARWNQVFAVLFEFYNFGKYCDSGKFELILDKRCHSKNIDSFTYDSASHTLRGNFKDLKSVQFFRRGFPIYMDTSKVKPDSILCFRARFYPACDELDSNDNEIEFCMKVVYSFDPNHKDCDKEIVPPKATSPLSYFIEFQNEGSDYAGDVVLRDTLSVLVNLESFRILGASHPYTASIDGRVLTITFKGINLLPKNQNEALSKGFIKYSVNTNANLSSGQKITNRASIYFDLNKPIMTNTSVTSVEWGMSLKNTIKADRIISLFPNPAANVLYLKNNSGLPQKADVYSAAGTWLLQIEIGSGTIKSLDLGSLSSGIYFVRCGSQAEQIVIAH